jgi:hypothetical protein
VADGKAMRSMRVDVALWDASMAKAKAEGRTLTDVVEALLARWVTTPQGDADGAVVLDRERVEQVHAELGRWLLGAGADR